MGMHVRKVEALSWQMDTRRKCTQKTKYATQCSIIGLVNMSPNHITKYRYQFLKV